MLYRNDKFPSWYTHVGNDIILFDAYNSDEDSALEKAKTMCGGLLYPSFTLEDSFIPDLDAAEFPYYLNKAKVRAFTEKKQIENREAAASARTQKVLIQKRKEKIFEGTAFEKMVLGRYGRK